MAIITTTNYKTYRSISVSTYDTVLGVLISSAQAMLERYCGRAFDSATYTDEAYDGNNAEYILLRQYPVTALTAVKLKDDAGNTTTYDTTDYRYEAASGRLFRLGAKRGRLAYDSFGVTLQPDFGVSPNWPGGFQNILVTYTAGYTTMPYDLQQLMYTLVDSLFYEVKDGGSDPTTQSETLGDYSYTRASKTLMSSASLSEIAHQFRRFYG